MKAKVPKVFLLRWLQRELSARGTTLSCNTFGIAWRYLQSTGSSIGFPWSIGHEGQRELNPILVAFCASLQWQGLLSYWCALLNDRDREVPNGPRRESY